MAIIDARQLALMNNNHFQLNGPIDQKTGITPMNTEDNEMLILEFNEDITNIKKEGLRMP